MYDSFSWVHWVTESQESANNNFKIWWESNIAISFYVKVPAAAQTQDTTILDIFVHYPRNVVVLSPSPIVNYQFEEEGIVLLYSGQTILDTTL